VYQDLKSDSYSTCYYSKAYRTDSYKLAKKGVLHDSLKRSLNQLHCQKLKRLNTNKKHTMHGAVHAGLFEID